jgi:hypothetical protein
MLCVCKYWVVQNTKQHPFLIHAGGVYAIFAFFFFFSLSTDIRSRFQVKPATLLIPIDLILFILVEDFYGTRYQSGSFSFINVGSCFPLPAQSFLFLSSLVGFLRIRTTLIHSYIELWFHAPFFIQTASKKIRIHSFISQGG